MNLTILKLLQPQLIIITLITMFSTSSNSSSNISHNTDATAIQINPKAMKHIGSVDERYQSYNVEMVEVVGGNFWRPYKTMDSLPSSTSSFDFSNRNQMFRK